MAQAVRWEAPRTDCEMRIRVHLCGTLTVEIDGREVTASLPGRQGRRLFAYLAANHERRVLRTELTDVLWPDAPPAAPEVAASSDAMPSAGVGS